MTLDLDTIQEMVNNQAYKKKWNRETDYCLNRAYEEMDELKEALKDIDRKAIQLEIIDIIYFLVQIAQSATPLMSLNQSFLDKYDDNWLKLKKTIDEKGNKVLR